MSRINVKRVFDGIAPFASRLQELDIEVDDIEQISFFSSKGGSVPLLRKLELYIETRGFKEPSEETPITVFNAAPALHDVKLDIQSEHLSQQSYFACPWHQLTSLDIDGPIPPKTFHDIFIQCRSIKRAFFTVGTPDDSNEVVDFPRHNTVFKHLSELKLSIEGIFKDETVFHNFVFPNPCLFELHVEDSSWPIIFNAIPPGINAASLQCLELTGDQLVMDNNSVNQYLARCLFLKTLILYLSRVPPGSIFRALTVVPLLS
ncbi:hypothetical protein DXG01_013052 [Tephrocybe rancida]|nr:hypothetical protein DXG01_013052 [Tephrocybe rancida]